MNELASHRLKTALTRGPLTTEGCDRLLNMGVGGLRKLTTNEALAIAYQPEPSTYEETI